MTVTVFQNGRGRWAYAVTQSDGYVFVSRYHFRSKEAAQKAGDKDASNYAPTTRATPETT